MSNLGVHFLFLDKLLFRPNTIIIFPKFFLFQFKNTTLLHDE